MFVLYAQKNQLSIQQKEPITSGSIKVYQARFEFSKDWDGLTKTACFRSGSQIISVFLGEDGECTIPWEVMDPDDAGKRLHAGVYGTKNGDLVLPTVWVDLGVILPGVSLGTNARDPAPSLWEQALARKADGMDLDGAELRLLSGETVLSSVTLPSGGGEGGGGGAITPENPIPIDAVAGLQEALETIPRTLTSDELRKILMIGE